MLAFIVIQGPIGSMYGIYANIWGILMVNVSLYSIHGSYGVYIIIYIIYYIYIYVYVCKKYNYNPNMFGTTF